MRECLLALLCLAAPASAWAGTTPLPPQNANVHCGPGAPCTQPTVDGQVHPLEYADGRTFPLQDYRSGRDNGQLYVAVSDLPVYASDECNVAPAPGADYVQTRPCVAETLFLGLHVPRPRDADGNLLPARGSLTVYLDVARGASLDPAASAALKPRSEDRSITVTFDTGANTLSVIHAIGNGAGGWAPLPAANWAFDTVAKAKTTLTDPRAHLELAIRLRTSVTGSTSEPLASGSRQLGLALQVRPTVAAVTGPWQLMSADFPNTPSLSLSSALVRTWETLDLRAPTPIPLSLSIWNVGQMPATAVTTGDGGSGEIDTIARALYKREAICLTEVWEASERVEIVEEVNGLRGLEGLPPMHVITDNDDNVVTVGGYTGLVFLSSRPIVEGGIHHFQRDACTGFDCWQNKGVIWARVATPAADPPKGTATAALPKGGSYGEFVDLFCTHVNAGDNAPGPDTDARQRQFFDLQAYIAQVRKGGPLHRSLYPYQLGEGDWYPTGTWRSGMDRPAFLLGDLNTLGPKGAQASGGYAAYETMMGPQYLDLLTPTFFERASSMFLDARDLGQSVLGVDPARSGTWLGGTCSTAVQSELSTKDRLDYVLVFPPETGTGFPAFALQSAKASVAAHWDPDSLFPDLATGQPAYQCLSDHAEVRVDIALVRVADVLKYNPAKAHRVQYAIKRVTDLETESGCCADWYSPRVYMKANGSWQVKDYLTVIENQTIHPNWYVRTGVTWPSSLPDLPAHHQGSVLATGSVWEEDSGGNDHYDGLWEGYSSTARDDRDAHFRFDAATGALYRVKGESPLEDWDTELDYLGNFQTGHPDGITYQTEGNDQQTSNNARVLHFFNVTEVE